GSFGLGDVRVTGRAVLYSQETLDDPSGFSLALAADLYAPTGDPDEFRGDAFRAEPRLAFDYAFSGGLRVLANLGYQIREARRFRNVEVDDLITYGAGVIVPVGDAVQVLGEVNGAVSALAATLDPEETPLELLGAGRFFITPAWTVLAGAGTGLIPGFGMPDFRLLLGVAYTAEADRQKTPPPPTDRDGDGLIDDSDLCPDDPEDKDGFEDVDGCPDPDNDQDGVLDTDDKCPLDPEDKDDFEDADGCPEPDNDKDGILDNVDQCPNEPEVIDGVADEDGCPDAPRLQVQCDRIELNGAIYFETDSAVIRKVSFALLDEIAAALAKHAEIKKVSIEGHTDDRGSDEYNLDLSTRRVESVRDYLVGKQVASERLVFKGLGEGKPIADNATEEGRAKNRRVEFRIVEADERPECQPKTP
ncbi:MAG: OmpA family protein, partial [Myxococcales bacterium]|nr:OmpA family protein [Myxococcales bacterium]